MAEKSNRTIPVSSGAEAFLAQMKELGSTRYMFANTGTDHGPLIEAMAKNAKEDPGDIQPIVVPHEQAAVSMAHGYYCVTQQPQMVLVHTLPGTANALYRYRRRTRSAPARPCQTKSCGATGRP